MRRITPTGLKVLKALAVYRFLTVVQFQRLGVSSDATHIRDTLRPLSRGRASPLGAIDLGVLPTMGRLPKVYYLTSHGAEILQELEGWELSKIQFARSKAISQKDFLHRLGCVDFHIKAREFARHNKQKMNFFHSYFDYAGKGVGMKAKTTLYIGKERATPDGVFQLSSGDASRLFVFEFSRGMDTKRVLAQMALLCVGIETHRFQDVYKYPFKPRIVWVFDTPNGLEAIKRRASNIGAIERQADAVFLKTVDSLASDFLGGWQSITGEEKALFPLL
jgi:Replication-relaxation|tara:strand:+ start:8095 stop:8925 length:831 start_codon:yes stop_codon:yes gene_type:complete